MAANNSRKNETFSRILFGEMAGPWKSNIFKMLEKTRVEKTEGQSHDFLKILNTGPIFSKDT